MGARQAVLDARLRVVNWSHPLRLPLDAPRQTIDLMVYDDLARESWMGRESGRDKRIGPV
jgi:hypothetical protein